MALALRQLLRPSRSSAAPRGSQGPARHPSLRVSGAGKIHRTQDQQREKGKPSDLDSELDGSSGAGEFWTCASSDGT